MAINTWFTAILNPNAAKIPDRADHHNQATPATADGGNVTVAYDSAVITTLTQLDSCLASIRAQIAARLSP